MAVLIYCDQNFLIRIGKESGPYQDRIRELISANDVILVISAWHWVELARDRNHARGLALADFAESLQPMWIRERRDLQRHEAEASFFSFLGVSYSRPSPLTSRAEIIAGINRVPVASVAQISSREFVGYLQSAPKAMAPIQAGYRKNVTALEAIRRAGAAGRLTPEMNKKFDRLYVARLLPSQTPAGLVIDTQSRKEFLESLDIQTCPSIAVEFAISQDGWHAVGGYRWQDFIDRQHAISALPYVDMMATDDVDLTKVILRIRPNLRFPTACPITKERFDRLYIRRPGWLSRLGKLLQRKLKGVLVT